MVEDQRSTKVNGQWSMVDAQWSTKVNGRWLIVDRRWSKVDGQWLMGNGRTQAMNGQCSMLNNVCANVGYFKLNSLCTALRKGTDAVGRRTLVRGNRRADGGRTD